MRNLATIQTIKAVEIHPNADTLEIASVLGWRVCVKKGEFKPGDKVVYIEVDSLLPRLPAFMFLFKGGDAEKETVRLKTVRLRGSISQGICFSLESLNIPQGTAEGQDVTDLLGIAKYEAPESSGGLFTAGDFPGGVIPKTDETRIQVLEYILSAYRHIRFAGTVKLDGSSTTLGAVSLTGDPLEDMILASRTKKLYLESQFRRKFPEQEGGKSHFEMACDSVNAVALLHKYCMENCRRLALQGETIGPGVQSNKYGLKNYTIRFFNVFDIDRQEYLPYNEKKRVLAEIGVPMVDTVVEDYILPKTVEELVAACNKPYATLGFRDIFPVNGLDEGIVFTPMDVEIRDFSAGGGLLHNNRLSFKVINQLFSLKYND